MGILKNLFNKKQEQQNFFFTPDNRKWGVDIDKFTKICLTSDNEKSKDTEITEEYQFHQSNDEGDDKESNPNIIQYHKSCKGTKNRRKKKGEKDKKAKKDPNFLCFRFFFVILPAKKRNL